MVGKKGKILFIILIFVLVFNFCSPVVLAGGLVSVEDAEAQADGYSDAAEQEAAMTEPTGNALGTVLDFSAGILFYPVKMFCWLFGQALLFIVDSVAGDGEEVTPETILFNKLPITTINFFDDNKGSDVEFIAKLKESIASWYYVMRTIAIVASLCVLLYIGIRMATSTIASEKAEYKRMLLDWAVGFALIFVLHYIIILVIYGNNTIVETLYKAMVDSSGAVGGGENLSTYISDVSKQVYGTVDLSKSLGAVIVFLILIVVTIAFLLMYIKRVIVVAFLIIIAPLITITYAIDKAGDNKSQALDTWLKEFVWTILIQPFHCVIYVVFVSVALNSLKTGGFDGSVLAVMCMMFILQAEDIIKKIFGIQADNIGKMSSSFALAAGGTLMAAKYFNKSGGAVASKAAKGVTSIANKAPKTTDGTGVGVGETAQPSSNSFTQKVANTVASPRVQNALNGFNSFMENNKVGKAMAATGNIVGKWVGTSYNVASGLGGAAVSLPTAQGVGDVAQGALAGVVAGQAFKAAGKWVGKKATVDIVEAGRTKNAVNNLNASYQQMQTEKGLSRTEMEEKAKAYLKVDLDSQTATKEMKEIDKLFAYNLQTMKHQLEKAGEDTSFENIMSKIRLIDNPENGNLGNNNSNNNNSGNNNSQMA